MVSSQIEHMKYTDIVIEKTEKGLSFPGQVWVCKDFEYSPFAFMGVAHVKEKDGIYTADLDIIEGKEVAGLYPCIGFVWHDANSGVIHVLGLCRGRNQDETINPLP